MPICAPFRKYVPSAYPGPAPGAELADTVRRGCGFGRRKRKGSPGLLSGQEASPVKDGLKREA